ncbi:uncharacterized protein LOC133514790 isoform X2 [Syngnathoides biaculeatus]|uniref:uncharacterized protein LOC133514790 isoform X2 n=1 Tax=Syngnathoides biaculeatus TaxID=300417 RepID=UPI002ADE342A|nr:uncharacterized protein LOC133514790 isoform X2 [Syngnathoides biaculeatus]
MLSPFDASADASLPATMSAAILACVVVLALICLRCRDDGPPAVSIREVSNTDDYIPSDHFRLVCRHQLTARLNSDLLSPFVTPSDRGSRRSSRSDVEPTESESNHSYQNNCEEQDLSESSSGDYLIVLPEDEPPATDGSGASTPSSGEAHDYENIREASPKDDRDYLNVSPLPPGEETPTLSSQSDDSDGEGKYVNEGSVMTSA